MIMKIKSLKSFILPLVTGLLLLTGSQRLAAQTADTSTPPPMPAAELPAGSELLTRGPVHEAFAKPVSTDPQAPLVIYQAPPAPVQEMPPVEKPDGANIVWVPGYWAWDTDRNDFIWVSGCWRNAPPNTYWVPGHWLQLDSGWEWITGFWRPVIADAQPDIVYLPTPPSAFELDAPEAPPTPDQIWVPGCWYWSDGQYIQRHGYWMASQVGWVWVPSHYAWTPRGCVFSPGHWDYDLDNRGVLFSPVYFPAGVRVQVGFVFSPGLCVDLGMLRLNLFVNPRYNHYCFGDYYDASYQRAGIYPWYQCQTSHSWYDPLFVHDQWQYGRTDANWAKRQSQQFKQLQSNRALRPAHTYTELQAQRERLPAAQRQERLLAEPIRTYAAAQSTPMKFERISNTERQQLTVRTAEASNLRNQRSSWEAPTRPAADPVNHASAPARQNYNRDTTPTPTRQNYNREAIPTPARQNYNRDITAAPAVRVTAPEREIVNTPTIRSQPAESRYIEKTAPTAPAPERSYRPPSGGNGKGQNAPATGGNWQK